MSRAAEEPTEPPPTHPGAGPRVVSVRERVRRETLDPDALHVVARLQRAGQAAYLVGGCVRDLLLGLEPKDFDVATDAVPNRIRRLFRNAWVIGRRFRLVHVRFADGKVIETATFRADPGEDGRHPAGEDRPIFSDNVFGTAAEDARRRDFTVNALFYDPFRDEVIDHVGGLDDLEARTVRAIGDPERRMKEDPVRMLRAVHFAARIGGRVEPALLEAIRTCALEIRKASPARLYVELMKVLTRGCARPSIQALHDLGVLAPWLPELCGGLEVPIEWPTASGGTHEAASRGEPEDAPASHLTWNLLGAADVWGLAARGAPESLALAVLFGPWLLESFRSAPLSRDLRIHVEEAFRPVALRMSIPRRASFEMHDILGLLDRLRHPPESRSRKQAILRRGAFDVALDFFELDLRARDRDLAPVDAWRAFAEEQRAGDERRRRSRDERWEDAEPEVVADAGEGLAPVDGEGFGESPLPRRGRRRRGRRGVAPSRAAWSPREAAPPEHEAPRPAAPRPRAEAPSPVAAPPPPPPPPRPSRRPFGEGLM